MNNGNLLMMKKLFAFCCTAMMLQTATAQYVELNGYKHDISGFSANDSTITLFPVDKEKLAALNPGNNDWVECPMPNYPSKMVQVYIGNKVIKQELSSYVEVIDTINKEKNTEEKREYIEFRLSVINAIREQLAEIKAQEGKKLKVENESQLVVYSEVMRQFGNPESEKEQSKFKVGKYSMTAIGQFEEQLAVEENSLKQVLEIPDTIEFLKTTVSAEGVVGRKTENIARSLNILMPDRLSGNASGSWTKNYIRAANRFEESVLETKKRNQEVFFKNPLLTDNAITVRNPKYTGIGYSEWAWLQSMKGDAYDDRLEHVQTTFPVEADFYKTDKYPDYQFYPLKYPIPGKGWYVIDNNKSLIGVQYKGFESDSLEKALMLYDFEHNAYNIKSESNGTQEWALYLLKKRGNHKADALQWAQLGVLVGAGMILDKEQELRNLYARRRITKAEYDRQMAELQQQAKKINQAANRVASSMPTAEEQDRADKYVKQLESDYYHKYSSSTVNAERLNGTQMMLYTNDNKVQALLTYYLDDIGKLNIAIDIIEKR